MWAEISSVLSQITRLTDRQTALSWLDRVACMQQMQHGNTKRWQWVPYCHLWVQCCTKYLAWGIWSRSNF